MSRNDARETAVSPLELRNILVESFSLNELYDLAFELDVDHEDLPGSRKSDIARELVKYLQRRNRLEDLSRLVAAHSQKYPQANPKEYDDSHRDVFSRYEIGLTNLHEQLGQTHKRYSDFLVYQQRLEENIIYVRRYGDTPTHRSQRAEIIDQLNELALSETGQSFNVLMVK